MAQVRIAGIQFLQRETKSQTYEHMFFSPLPAFVGSLMKTEKRAALSRRNKARVPHLC